MGKVVSQETLEVLEGIRKEIVAGKVMVPVDGEGRGWNGASDRAVRILDMYREGRGLFQQ
jgi:hypothetical protein